MHALNSIRLALVMLASLMGAPAHAQAVVCGVNLSEIPGAIGGIGPFQNQNRNTITVTGPYFIQSSTIRFNPGEGILVRDGGVLVLCGEQGTNELRGNFTPDWDGITVEAGGRLIVQRTILRGGRNTLIRAQAGSDVTILLSELVDGPGRYIQAEAGARVEVVATTFRGEDTGSSPNQANYDFTSAIYATDAETIVDGCRFVDFPSSPDRDRGTDGTFNSDGSAGRPHFTLYANGGTLELTRSTFRNIEGGMGGRGGDGTSGTPGDDGENPLFGGAEDGEPGTPGRPGGTGGEGGGVFVVIAIAVDDFLAAHNSFYDIRGGTGGTGGNGGRGGNGGDGADGGNGSFGIPAGDGGNGGDGGDGGRGGNGGPGGAISAFRVDIPQGPAIMVNNTLTRVLRGDGGQQGFGGPGASEGVGGNGGNGSFGSSDGDDGSSGDPGDPGQPGSLGDSSIPIAFRLVQPSVQHPPRINNNIIDFGFNQNGRAIQSAGLNSGVVDISGNLVWDHGIVAIGTSLGASTIVVADPLIDGVSADFPVPPADSPAVDAGINAFTPPFLMRDVLGRPRFADVLSTPDTGDNGGFPGLGVVDIGAVEVFGVVCPLDSNMDGRIDRDDILIAIEGADFLDIARTLNNFEDGCGG